MAFDTRLEVQVSQLDHFLVARWGLVLLILVDWDDKAGPCWLFCVVLELGPIVDVDGSNFAWRFFGVT